MSLQNFLQNKSLCCIKFGKVILFSCPEISKRRVVTVLESNGLNLFWRIEGLMEQGLGAFLLLPQVVLIFSIKRSRAVSLQK